MTVSKDTDKEIKSRDMSDTCSPSSHLDFKGLNRVQAKEEIAKIIDEKIERLSTMEMSEHGLVDKDRQKAKAAERITERRTRKKEKNVTKKVPTLAEQYYLDHKSSSIFDIIQPEKNDFIVETKVVKEPSAAIDSSIDKIFAFFSRIGNKFSGLGQRITVILGKKESKASDKMANFITILDNKFEKTINWITGVLKNIGHKIYLAREYADINKKKLLIRFGLSVATVMLFMLALGSMTAYEYIYNGKVLGLVKNQEDVYKIIDIIGDKLSYEYHAEITIDKEKDITFNKVIAISKEIDDKEDILNRLTYMKNMKAKGYGIFVNGNMVAVLESKDSAKEILDEMKDRYVKADDKIKYERVGFAEHVTIQDIETKLGDIEKQEDVMDYILTGAMQKKIHIVETGETFSEIAKIYGMNQGELQASNPDLNPEKLSVGQEVSLTQIVPLITVQTIEVATYIEEIPYGIAYENTSAIYKGEQTVKSRGKNGEKEVVAEIIRNNGIEVGRTEIKSTILSQPSSQIVLVGTKDPPPLIGTGTFQYPIRGTLTSRFGTRWGRLHAGIDLAAPTGTKIRASDGGKVIFSGYSGSYGYVVKIDHGGNRVTVYAHCSKLLVKVGEKVYQGQHIANVGNTGRSTGPHLHFEVQINGIAKNPLNYL